MAARAADPARLLARPVRLCARRVPLPRASARSREPSVTSAVTEASPSRAWSLPRHARSRRDTSDADGRFSLFVQVRDGVRFGTPEASPSATVTACEESVLRRHRAEHRPRAAPARLKRRSRRAPPGASPRAGSSPAQYGHTVAIGDRPQPRLRPQRTHHLGLSTRRRSAVVETRSRRVDAQTFRGVWRT